MTEGEERAYFLSVEPAVADHDAFVVADVDDVAVGAFCAGIFADGVGGDVVESDGEGHGQFARRVDASEDYVGQRVARFRSEEPCLKDSGDFIGPWHSHGVAADIDDNRARIGGHEGFDDGVLIVGECEAFAVGVFAVLSGSFVEAADEDDDVGASGGVGSVGDEAVGAAALAEILTRGHAVVFTCRVADISALPDYGRTCGRLSAQAVERRSLALHFQ